MLAGKPLLAAAQKLSANYDALLADNCESPQDHATAGPAIYNAARRLAVGEFIRVQRKRAKRAVAGGRHFLTISMSASTPDLAYFSSAESVSSCTASSACIRVA